MEHFSAAQRQCKLPADVHIRKQDLFCPAPRAVHLIFRNVKNAHIGLVQLITEAVCLQRRFQSFPCPLLFRGAAVFNDADAQLLLARKAAKNGLSVRETERQAAKLEKKPAQKTRQGAKTDEIRGVEQELTSATGVRVNITGDGRKGSVELRYFDRQGLEEIIELLRNARTGRK